MQGFTNPAKYLYFCDWVHYLKLKPISKGIEVHLPAYQENGLKQAESNESILGCSLRQHNAGSIDP
jgi:hypothetical protein